MSVLQDLQPKAVFHYFEEIANIPHGSGNCKGISDYLVAFAKERKLAVVQDEMYNVIITKPATSGYEQAPTVMLQGHMDMVAVKTEDCDLDMETQGLRLKIDGDEIYAEGTTLGGDDGVALAISLALLDASDIPHPKLEAVFTVDEEIGLLGAAGIDLSQTTGKMLVNLDAGGDDKFLTSCAGGCTTSIDLAVARQQYEGIELQVSINGLLGGHSGAEIDKGRANATKLLARYLYALQMSQEIRVVALEGGNKDNVIPSVSTATLLLSGDAEAAVALAKEFDASFKNEFQFTDADVTLSVTVGEKRIGLALMEDATQKVISLLHTLPNGIQTMSAAMPGLVESSLNLGILSLSRENLHASFSVRSSVPSLKMDQVHRLQDLAGLVGATFAVHGDYPAWEYNPDSKLRDIFVDAYRALYHEEPQIDAIHAGLECGFLTGKVEGLDCIAMGPNMRDIHSYHERLSISSTAKVWEVVKEGLKRLK